MVKTVFFVGKNYWQCSNSFKLANWKIIKPCPKIKSEKN